MVTLQVLQKCRRWLRKKPRIAGRVRARPPTLEFLEDRLCPTGLFDTDAGFVEPLAASSATQVSLPSPPAQTAPAGSAVSLATTTILTAAVSGSPSMYSSQTIAAPAVGSMAVPAVENGGNGPSFNGVPLATNATAATDAAGPVYRVEVFRMSAAAVGMPTIARAEVLHVNAPVVTPSITQAPSFLTAEVAPPLRVFRVECAPADGPPMEIAYSLRLYHGSDSVSHAGAIVLADGTAAAGLRLDWGPLAQRDAAALAVLTLAEHPSYQLGIRAVTMFTACAPERCGEAVLLDAFQQGQSPEAFAALVARYRSAVFQTCLQILGNRQDAEDVMQLVFMALADRQVRFQITLARWLRVVARNTAIMVMRARRRRARHEGAVVPPDSARPETEIRDLSEELDTALRQVPGALQEAVRLRYLEARPQKEAAEMVGCPRGTLARRAANGIRRLRDILGQRGNLA